MPIRNNRDIDRILDEFFSSVSDQDLKQMEDLIKSLDIGGPTVKEYFKRVFFLEKLRQMISSGKLEQTTDMDFLREGFQGKKLLDNENAYLGLLSVTKPINHPKKEVKEGIRIYRIEKGSGSFQIFHRNGKMELIDVTEEDVIFILAGDSYSYSMTEESRMFEVNLY